MTPDERSSIRSQASTAVDQIFTRQREDLARMQKDEAQAHREARVREMQSFKDNRDAAINRHRGQMQTIDSREQKALAAMQKQSGTLKERLTGFFQPGRQERQEQAIKEKFETERMQKHRDLEALKERQFNTEQGARLRYAQDEKRMQERFTQERREQTGQQAERREPMVRQQAHAIAEAQLREGLRREKEHDHQQEQAKGHSR